jgi:iron complex outermembrane receptor protein
MRSLEYERIDQQNAAHRLRGVPVDADGTFLADYRWTSTEPGDYTDLRAHVAQFRWDQRLGTQGRLDSTFRWLSSERDENYHEPRGITGGGTEMQREFRDQFRTNDDWSWNVNLNTPLRADATTHDLSTGVEVVSQDFLFRSATARQANVGGPVPALALINPVYGVVNTAAYGLTPDRYTTETATTRRLGLYVQDLIGLGPRVNVLVGGRVDTFEDRGVSAGRDLAADQTAATGRIGVVYKPRPRLSLYGTVANGFTRAPVLTQSPSANGPHEAETAQQFETGAKSEWLDGRVQLTGAFFTIVKQNVLRPDPNFGPGGDNVNAVLPVGEIRNRGVEVDLAGSPLPRWNLAFNYAFLDSAITDDVNPALVGRPMPNAAGRRG